MIWSASFHPHRRKVLSNLSSPTLERTRHSDGFANGVCSWPFAAIGVVFLQKIHRWRDEMAQSGIMQRLAGGGGSSQAAPVQRAPMSSPLQGLKSFLMGDKGWQPGQGTSFAQHAQMQAAPQAQAPDMAALAKIIREGTPEQKAAAMTQLRAATGSVGMAMGGPVAGKDMGQPAGGGMPMGPESMSGIMGLMKGGQGGGMSGLMSLLQKRGGGMPVNFGSHTGPVMQKPGGGMGIPTNMGPGSGLAPVGYPMQPGRMPYR
jgi:hypothetical protein